MIFGEGPGPVEDDKGLPFVGSSGILLNKMLKLLGWSRDEVFVDNLVACFPCQETEDRWVIRKPNMNEIMACRPRVVETIRQIDPLLIITLGATALHGLTGNTASITKARGELFFAHIPGIYKKISYPVFPTFHPAYVLRMGERESAGEINGDAPAVRGPDGPMALFKKDLVHARNYLNSITALYGR